MIKETSNLPEIRDWDAKHQRTMVWGGAVVVERNKLRLTYGLQ